MAKCCLQGTQGTPIILKLNFYDNGVLFDPDVIQDVDILTEALVVVTTLTPARLDVGRYQVTWNIPADQTPATYYHRWTWRAQAGMDFITQTYRFEVLEAPTLPFYDSIKKKCRDRAPGYWGRNIEKRITNEKIPEKVASLLIDKLESRGKRVYLWNQVDENCFGSLECSCIKDTTNRPDITCSSCYGTKWIPGYIRFAHETLFVASVSPGIVLTNTYIDTNIKPYRIVLSDTYTTGTIESGAVAFSNNDAFDWEIQLDTPNIKSTNTINVEFSTNDVDYYPIDEINEQAKKPVGLGNIYLKITITRANAEDRSPEFEIMRLRHAKYEDPYIKILRPQVTEIPTFGQWGGRVEHAGERFWTVPLNYFDNTIPANTTAARITENAFYERVDGINSGIKYVTTKLSYDEELGTFTQQSFEPRRVQTEEVYNRLVF